MLAPILTWTVPCIQLAHWKFVLMEPTTQAVWTPFLMTLVATCIITTQVRQ